MDTKYDSKPVVSVNYIYTLYMKGMESFHLNFFLAVKIAL